MVLHIRVRRRQFVQLSVRFQLVHKIVSRDEGVNANVSERKKHGENSFIPIGWPSTSTHLSIRSAQLSLPILHSEQSLFKNVTVLISSCGKDMKNVLQDQKDDIVFQQITHSTHRKG